jgi:hypothetical protein
MQVTADLLLFRVVEYQLLQRLAAAVVVTEILQVPQVDQAAAVATEARVDLEVKVTPEALAYPTAQVTG